MLRTLQTRRRRAQAIARCAPENLEPRQLLTAGLVDDCCADTLEVSASAASDFQATAVSDRAGSSRATALRLGEIDGQQSLRGYVGQNGRFRDRSDYFQFTVDTESDVSIRLSGLSSDVDLYLANSSGRSIGRSTNSGTRSDQISGTLEAGTYYAVAIPWRNSSSFYNLSFDVNATNSVTPTPTPAPTPPVAAPVSPTPTPASFNSVTGYGLVDANAAVNAALGNQTLFANQPTYGGFDDWNVNQIAAPEVWAEGYTGEGIVVAVVDSGVDYRHADLSGNIWSNTDEIIGNGIDDDGNGYIDDGVGWDFIGNDNDPSDTNNHGTHVAGTIAGSRNGFGVTGIAYNATIMPVRVLGGNGSGSHFSVAQGIRYAADNGADIINLSLGGGFSSLIQDAVRYAFNAGSVVVMASGNDGAASPGNPASFATDFGIAVGAVDRNNNVAGFSNRAGTQTLDYVVAPGVGVLSSVAGGRYARLSGTSMATPHVAGVAALILSANPDLTPAQVESILVSTAGGGAASSFGSSSPGSSGTTSIRSTPIIVRATPATSGQSSLFASAGTEQAQRVVLQANSDDSLLSSESSLTTRRDQGLLESSDEDQLLTVNETETHSPQVDTPLTAISALDDLFIDFALLT